MERIRRASSDSLASRAGMPSAALWSALRQVIRPARPEVVLRRIISAVRRVPGISAAGAYLLDTERKSYVLVFSQGLPPDFQDKVRVVPVDSALGESIRRRGALYREYHQIMRHPVYEGSGLRSLGAIPIHHQGEVVATLNVASSTVDRIPPASRRMVETIAARLGTLVVQMRAQRAEERATAELRGFRRLIESGPAVAMASGPPPDYPAEFVSENIRRFGYRASDLVGGKRPLIQLVHPDDRRAMARLLTAPAKDWKGARRVECRLLRKDGSFRWVESYLQRRKGRRGRPLGYQGTLLDITARRQAEEASRAADRRFRQIAEHVRDVYWVAQLPGWEWLYCSPSIRELLGREPESLRTRTDWEALCHPDDVVNLRSALRSASRGDSLPVLVRMRRPDGSDRWVEVRGYPVRDATRKIVRVAGTVCDMTHEVRIRGALQRQVAVEGMIRRIARRFVMTPGPRPRAVLRWALAEMGRFMVLDRVRIFAVPEGKDALFSEIWQRRGLPSTRFDIDAIPEGRFAAMMRPLMLGRHVAVDSVAALPPEAADIRAEAEADGVRSMLALPVMVEGRPVGVLVLSMLRSERSWTAEDIRVGRIMADITAQAIGRRRAENELRTNARRLRTIIEEAGDAILLLDLSGRIRDANRAGCAMLRRTKRQLRGKPVGRLLPRQGEALAAGRLPDAPGGGLVTVEEIPRAGGSVLVAETRARRLPGGDILAIVRDVTERRRREHSLMNLAAREHQRLGRDLHDTIGQQIGGLAFLTYAVQRQLADRGAPEAKAVGQILDQLRKTLSETRHIAHGLAPMAVAERGLVDALRLLAEETAETFGIACEFESAVKGRLRDGQVEQHLYQVASEAIHNAARHSGARRVVLGFSADAVRGRLTVEDDGIWKASGRSSHGAGLRLMRHRAELIGGELTIEHGAAAGRGTRLACTFLNRTPPASR